MTSCLMVGVPEDAVDDPAPFGECAAPPLLLLLLLLPPRFPLTFSPLIAAAGAK